MNEADGREAGSAQLEDRESIERIASFPLSKPEPEETQGFSKTASVKHLDLHQRKIQQKHLWDKHMCDYRNIQRGCPEVTVLLTRWAEEIADPNLNATLETAHIEALFKNNFNYNTVNVVLGSNNPQTQLQNQAKGLCTALSESSLLILYYNGHGVVHSVGDKKYLKLQPYVLASFSYLNISDQFRNNNDDQRINLDWTSIEDVLLQNFTGNVLTIMDCCFAGAVRSVLQTKNGKLWEYLGACGEDQLTGTKDTSFSKTLVEALGALHAKHESFGFNTLDLLSKVEDLTKLNLTKMKKKPHQPHVMPCYYRRNECRVSDYIILAPIKRIAFSNEPIKNYMDLRIELKEDSLDERQLEDLCRAICKGVEDCDTVRTRRIDLLGIHPPKLNIRTAVHAVMAYQRFGSKHREHSPPISKPGVFATVGFMDQAYTIHKKTFTLLKPWAKVITAVAVFTFLRWWFRSKTPWTLIRNKLYSLTHVCFR
jgi:hypothetical protein